jgi:hypothetical protein
LLQSVESPFTSPPGTRVGVRFAPIGIGSVGGPAFLEFDRCAGFRPTRYRLTAVPLITYGLVAVSSWTYIVQGEKWLPLAVMKLIEVVPGPIDSA